MTDLEKNIAILVNKGYFKKQEGSELYNKVMDEGFKVEDYPGTGLIYRLKAGDGNVAFIICTQEFLANLTNYNAGTKRRFAIAFCNGEYNGCRQISQIEAILLTHIFNKPNLQIHISDIIEFAKNNNLIPADAIERNYITECIVNIINIISEVTGNRYLLSEHRSTSIYTLTTPQY